MPFGLELLVKMQQYGDIISLNNYELEFHFKILE